MYKDPITSEDVLTHPAELQRIQGYRDHGFDELSPIHTWILDQLKNHGWNSFHTTLKDSNDPALAKNYIFANCEKHSDDAVPHYAIELEVGYFDFQDAEQTPVASIDFVLYEKSKLITLKSASSHALATDNVVRVLSDIVDGPYLKFN